MRIVQLSDLHLRPDLLLMTGDLADDGVPSTYEALHRRLANAGIPFALLPGNHDRRDALRSAFPALSTAGTGRLDQRIDHGEVSLLMPTPCGRVRRAAN
ncbi:MAG: metallophosphoesterase family protein [Azonexus sp.]